MTYKGFKLTYRPITQHIPLFNNSSSYNSLRLIVGDADQIGVVQILHASVLAPVNGIPGNPCHIGELAELRLLTYRNFEFRSSPAYLGL